MSSLQYVQLNDITIIFCILHNNRINPFKLSIHEHLKIFRMICVYSGFKSLHMPPHAPIPLALTILRWSPFCYGQLCVPYFIKLRYSMRNPKHIYTHFRFSGCKMYSISFWIKCCCLLSLAFSYGCISFFINVNRMIFIIRTPNSGPSIEHLPISSLLTKFIHLNGDAFRQYIFFPPYRVSTRGTFRK